MKNCNWKYCRRSSPHCYWKSAVSSNRNSRFKLRSVKVACLRGLFGLNSPFWKEGTGIFCWGVLRRFCCWISQEYASNSSFYCLMLKAVVHRCSSTAKKLPNWTWFLRTRFPKLDESKTHQWSINKLGLAIRTLSLFEK